MKGGKPSRVETRIGTSGYIYPWNEGKPDPFTWYLQQGFNSVEINASFYRFPSKSWGERWSKAPEGFDFTIKVHRSITHYTRLRGKASELWIRFSSILEPLYDRITFWLFQFGPQFLPNEGNLEALKSFFSRLDWVKEGRVVVEFREEGWWRLVDTIRDLGLIFCSVDSPQMPRDLIISRDTLYLRIHGRSEWYTYIYSDEELAELVERIKRCAAKRRYIYLNNDHGMLPNGRYLMKAFGLLP